MTTIFRSTPFRLSLMMFFQYMLFAVWWVPLAAYLTNMNVEGTQKALILSSMAIGCMASPVIGMVADRFFASEKVLAVRYLDFYIGGVAAQPSFYFAGILVHGVIYGYFFLGGQIYIDKKAPAELRAQAQGFIFLVTFGLGLLVGNFISRQVIEMNLQEGVYNWDTIWGMTTLSSAALAVAMIVFFRNEKEIISK